MKKEEIPNCPHCGSSQVGVEIPTEYLEKGYYGEWDGKTPQFYVRTIMVEISGVYDGGLYLQCPDCGKAWHRWGSTHRLHKVATPYINARNREVDASHV